MTYSEALPTQRQRQRTVFPIWHRQNQTTIINSMLEDRKPV